MKFSWRVSPIYVFLFLVLPLLAMGQNKTKDSTRLPLITIETQSDSVKKEVLSADLIKKEKKEITQRFYFFIAGFSLLMAIYLFFKSGINDWDKANLYAALMFLCNFLNVWLWTDAFPVKQIFGIVPMGVIGLWFNQTVPIFTLLLYRAFLQIKKERPQLYRFMTIAIVALFLCNTAMFVQIVAKLPTTYFNFEKLFEQLFLVTEFILPFTFLRYWQHPIFRLATWSSWIIALSFVLYFTLSHGSFAQKLPVWFNPVFILFTALMIDGILFLFALALRDRQIVVEKKQLEHQVTANELKALRAQMNPHFIFNSLNSIKSFTLNNDTEGANFYLTKFSKLIRQVLDNSRNEKIALKNELETLGLYLDMEKLRVGDKFDYQIKINEDVETEFIEIPPMLIQPYVENAIWHGLMHKDGRGTVLIDVAIKNDTHLIISILDDGIGREKSAELKSKTGAIHKSFGMKITAERLAIIKQLYNIEAKIHFEDLKNADGSATGTKVTLEIPL